MQQLSSHQINFLARTHLDTSCPDNGPSQTKEVLKVATYPLKPYSGVAAYKGRRDPLRTVALGCG